MVRWNISAKSVVKIFHLLQIWLATKQFIQKKKNSSAVTQTAAEATKLGLNTITIIITGTSKSQQSHRKLSVVSVTKSSPKSNV